MAVVVEFAVTVIDESVPPRDAQIWVFDLGASDRRAPFRCDDGEFELRFRADPESFIGSQQVFVLYYVFQRDAISLYRCATGIRTKE